MTTSVAITRVLCYNVYNDFREDPEKRDLDNLGFIIMTNNYFMNRKEVVAYTAISRSTIDRKEPKGNFPKRVQVGSNSVRWVFSEVHEWCEEQKNKRLLHS